MLNPVLVRAIPFGIYIAFLVIESAFQNDIPWFDARWLYLLKVVCVAVALGALWKRYEELRQPVRVRVAGWFASVVVGILVFIAWINLDQSWAVLGAAHGWNPKGPDGAINWGLVAVRIAGAAAVVPIMEELFWRSLVLRWIRSADFLSVVPANAGAMALMASSVLFALEHHEWFAGLIAGVAYAGTYMRTGNLWCAVIAHAVTNLLLGVWVVHTGQWQFW